MYKVDLTILQMVLLDCRSEMMKTTKGYHCLKGFHMIAGSSKFYKRKTVYTNGMVVGMFKSMTE